MKFIKFVLYYALGLVGILFISSSSALFRNEAFFDLSNYWDSLGILLKTILHPDEWVYLFKGNEVPIFEYLWEPYQYSMTVFFGGILLGFFLACAGAVLTMFLPKWLKGLVDRMVGLLESVPDLLLAFSLQLLVVWVYNQTDILVFKFASLGQDKVYLLPIMALAVLPMVTMYRIVLALLEEEWTKPYVQMAKGKGLEKAAIIFIHISRNIGRSMFHHSKIIVWGALSSLLMIEYIFNMNGITSVFLNDFRPIVTFFILLMLFTPFYILYQGTEMFFASISWRSGGRWFIQALNEIVVHFKNVKFLLGFVVIAGAVLVSIVYTNTADPLIDQYRLIYDDAGNLVSSVPHSPEFVFLGTDPLGFSIFDQILVGAKYTILFGVIIAFLRMFLGFVLAIPYAFLLPARLQVFSTKVIDSMHFLPMTILAFLLLRPVLWMPYEGFTTTETERIVYQGVVLTVLAVPLVMTLFGNEMKSMMRKEFITSARVLGGGPIHLLWKHLLPHLSTKMGIIFGQQFIQTMLIFIHLGVFDIYFGGTKVSYDPMMADPPVTTTYEWSGMIGAAKDSLMTGQWWLIIPTLFCFMAIIVAMQFMIQGMKEVQQRRVGVSVEQNNGLKRLFQRKEAEKVDETPIKKNDFVFIQRNHAPSKSDEEGNRRRWSS